jgi:hypothetical protein
MATLVGRVRPDVVLPDRIEFALRSRDTKLGAVKGACLFAESLVHGPSPLACESAREVLPQGKEPAIVCAAQGEPASPFRPSRRGAERFHSGSF